jgi:RNA polymerase sigma-32 factor
MLMEAMENLNARERDIIVHRRLAEDQVTLEELSQRYNISRERVRQIEARALEKMTKHVLAAAAKPALVAPKNAA